MEWVEVFQLIHCVYAITDLAEFLLLNPTHSIQYLFVIIFLD